MGGTERGPHDHRGAHRGRRVRGPRAGSASPGSVTYANDDDASPDGVGRPGGIKSAENGAATDGNQSTNGNIESI